MRLWKRNRSAGPSVTTSIIDVGCELQGQFAFVGTLIVNGKLSGEVRSPDTLLVGETGVVEADIGVGVAVISGRVDGNIAASERVVLRASARVSGEIKTSKLRLEEGAIFDGHSTMSEKPLAVVEKLPIKQRAHG